MLWDRMRFHLDDLTLEQALTGSFANAFLKTFDQGLIFLHGPCPHGDVVVFREHPGIKVR